MTREEFAGFLAKLKTAKETGLDLDVCVARLTSSMVKGGVEPHLENLHVVSSR